MSKTKTQSNVTRLDLGRRIAEQGGVNGEPYEPLPPAKPVDPPPKPKDPPPPPEPKDLAHQVADLVTSQVVEAVGRMLDLDGQAAELRRRLDEVRGSDSRIWTLLREQRGKPDPARRPVLHIVKDGDR